MSGKRDDDTGKRRDFLKLAGLAAVTGGGLLAGGAKPAEAAVDSDTASDDYRETEHVKTYYKLARF